MNNKKTILGIDPGISITGYGIITNNKENNNIIQHGIINLNKYKTQENKLKKIFFTIIEIIEKHNPNAVAIESPFHGKNTQAMLKLAKAQTTAIAATISKQIPIKEYTPRTIKKSITGNGNASKQQIAYMINKILSPQTPIQQLDTSDALAIALCHIFQSNNNNNKTKTWQSFIKNNQHRVKTT